ncbi:MAG: hypothetical protein QXK95_02690 [Nitrososphaerota archaeon]|nr:40S ribosomal protein S25 [Candidatus Geocrenenecus dongiae]
MGGAKKPSISQLEKKLLKSKEEEKQQTKEKMSGGVIPPSIDEVVSFIKTQKYLTPTVVAEKFGIKLSIAKQVLNRLAEMKLVKLVAGDSDFKIYAPVEIAAAVEKHAAKEEVKEKTPAPKTSKKKKKE